MNSTTVGAVSILPSYEGRYITQSLSDLPHIVMTIVNRYRPELDILWVLLTYSPFLYQTYSYISSRKTRAHQYPYPAMLGHIFVAPLYILRWHARYAALRVWPKPEPFDLVLFATFWLSSLSLELSRVKQGRDIPLVRAGFQVAIAMHGICFAMAWTSSSSSSSFLPGGGLNGQNQQAAALWFRATVKYFNWFASFRGGGRLLARLDPKLMKNPVAAVSMTMVTTGSYALWEAGIPNAVPVFLLSMAALVLGKRALAEKMAKYDDETVLKRLLLSMGYRDHEMDTHQADASDLNASGVAKGDGSKVAL